MANTEAQKLNLLARFFQKEFFSYGSRLNQSKQGLFILIAFLLHVSILTFELITPLSIKKPPPPIKVKYVDTQKSELLKPKKLSADSPKIDPPKKNKPSKLMASTKQKKNLKKQYPEKKSTNSKTNNTSNIIKKPKTQVTKKQKKKTLKKISPSPSVFVGKKKTLSMLDGLNREKYTSQDLPVAERAILEDDKPISLDTKEKKYASYFSRIKQQIQRSWIYPVQEKNKRKSGELTLRFEIGNNGNLLGLQLVNTSGTEVLDINAIKAVKEAAPYYPFPKTISKKKLSILATFVYSAN
jgi:periplasmic protein TonB